MLRNPPAALPQAELIVLSEAPPYPQGPPVVAQRSGVGAPADCSDGWSLEADLLLDRAKPPSCQADRSCGCKGRISTCLREDGGRQPQEVRTPPKRESRRNVRILHRNTAREGAAQEHSLPHRQIPNGEQKHIP